MTDRPTMSGPQVADEPLDRFADAALDEDQIGDRHTMVRVDVARQRRQRAVRHPHATGGMCSKESGIESSRTFMDLACRFGSQHSNLDQQAREVKHAALVNDVAVLQPVDERAGDLDAPAGRRDAKEFTGMASGDPAEQRGTIAVHEQILSV